MLDYRLPIVLCLLSMIGLITIVILFGGKLIDKVFVLARILAVYLSKYFKYKWSLLIAEILFFIFIGFLAYIYLSSISRYIKIILSFTLFFIIVFSDLTIIIRKNNSKSFSIVQVSKNIIKKVGNILINLRLFKNFLFLFIINTIRQIFKQLFSLYIVLLVLCVMFKIITIPNLPDSAYFYLFLLIPVTANTWIYFVYGKDRPRNSEDANMRRIICYIIIFILLFIDSRTKLLEFTVYGKINTTANLLVSGVVTVLFIGIDRILKIIVDDYDRFKEKQIQLREEENHAIL